MQAGQFERVVPYDSPDRRWDPLWRDLNKTRTYMPESMHLLWIERLHRVFLADDEALRALSAMISPGSAPFPASPISPPPTATPVSLLPWCFLVNDRSVLLVTSVGYCHYKQNAAIARE